MVWAVAIDNASGGPQALTLFVGEESLIKKKWGGCIIVKNYP